MKVLTVFFRTLRTLRSHPYCYFNFLKLSVFAITLCHASFVLADDDFSPEQCNDIKRQDGFSVAFTVPDPKAATITLESNKPDVTLWSSIVRSTAYITDVKVNPGDRVLLVYRPISNSGKYGRLIYKLDTGSGYVQKEATSIWISGGYGTLQVKGDTVVVECADGEEEPGPEPIPDLKSVHYEFGTIEGLNCTNGCSLRFKETYENPIVFLMSTIIPDGISNETTKPTKSSVKNIWSNKKGATILSESPPGILPADRMSPIYYFVTEPGKLEFITNDGKHIFGEAGIVNTNKVQCKKDGACDVSKKGWETIDYHDDLDELDNPVVMAQVQGKDGDWSTTALRNINATSFDVALEVGRQKSPTSSKNIAYLAVDSFIGTDLSGESKVIFAKAPGEYEQKEEPDNSLQWSCNNNEIIFPGSTIFEKFGVIANKQTRNGGDGGWLRYCKQASDSTESNFTFAFDEDIDDLTKRKHGTGEKVGYFSYELPDVVIPNNVCDVFPEPIQAWTGSNSSLVLNSGSNSRFNGWSLDYLNVFSIDNDRSWSPSNPNPEKLLLLGFDSEGGTNQIYNHDVCGDDLGCAVGNEDSQLNRRKIDHNLLPDVPSRSVTDTLSVDKNIKARCDASNLCSFELAGSNANVYINEDLKRLYINDLGNEYTEVRVYLKDGLYIDDFEISNGNGLVLVVPHQSSVTFNKFLAMGTDNSDFIFENSSKINVITSFKFQKRVDIVHDSAYPVIYAPNAIVQMQGNFRGFILANELTPLNSLNVQGAVTALDVHSTSGLVINKPDYSCPLPPIEEGELTVTPIELHSLTCDTAAVEFAIKKDGQVVESVNDSFIAMVNPSSNTQWCENQNGTNCFDSGHSFSLDNGIKTLYLKSSILKNKPGYEVSGKWNGDEVTSAQFIEFVPFKIAFPDAPYDVIAGKRNSNLVKAQVMSCSPTESDPLPIATDYIGVPEVQLDIQAPYDGDHDEGLIDYQPKFEVGADEPGVTIDDLAIDESGEFFVTLTDSEFDCSELGDDCPIDGTGVLSGSFKLNSRPWTIAICDVKNIDGTRTNPAKTIEKGNGSYFIPAGKPFKATFKPVIHSDYYHSNDQTVPVLCDHRSTKNYYTVAQSGKEHNAPFTITFDLEYPAPSTGASLANLEGFSETFEFSKPSRPSQPVTREEVFVWNEVGSVLLKSDANYHDEDLAQSTQTVGRFYPDYFRITGTTWTEPDDQDGFTYMSQSFKNVNFQVTAYNAAEPRNQPTNNYQHFDPTLTRVFDLAGAYSDRVSITTSELSKDYWKSGAIWDASFTNVQWLRLAQDQASTIPDGPFNSGGSFGIESELKLAIVADVESDPTVFKVTSSDRGSQEQQLLAQPHVRYGRMALTDVGTSTNQVVKIPLRVEYWQGVNGFVLSSGDNASRFDVDEQCREVIWSDVGTSSAELFKLDPNEIDKVSGGEATALFARQGADTSGSYSREQVRLFLRQGTGNPSNVSCSWSDGDQDYLQYNWRQLGDEDPSTVVTFGIYRGNDRVIYRGESGLTGQ